MPVTRAQARGVHGVPGPDVRGASHVRLEDALGDDFHRSASGESIDLVDLTSRSSSPGPYPRVPPVFTIDLSLAPDQRYVELARAYKDRILNLTSLFDELLEQAGLPRKAIKWLARVLLRRLYTLEQTQEIRGIHNVTGVDMYLLVALNVLLDTFMGCTSGGMRIKDGRKDKMAHFRCLDWSMDELRHVLVQLDFIERRGGPVVATTINYVGYVGVLTGVR
jgi:hypothetical protein